MRNSNLLMDEPPIAVLPKLAALLGLDAAVFLQQVHYWYGKNKGRPPYNTIAQWCEEMPFFKPRTLERIIKELKNRGVLVVKIIAINNVKTGEYSIDYDIFDAMVSLENDADNEHHDKMAGCKNANEGMPSHTRKSISDSRANRQNDGLQTDKLAEGNRQNGGMQADKMAGLNYIQRSNTETTTTTANNVVWPKIVDDEEREKIIVHFERLIRAQTNFTPQDLLDEMQKRGTKKIIGNTVGYIRKLVDVAVAGKLVLEVNHLGREARELHVKSIEMRQNQKAS